MKFLSCLVLFILFSSQPSLCLEQDVNLVINPKVAWQGKIIAIKLLSAEGISKVKGKFLNQDFECYKIGNAFRGIVGVSINQKPSHYDLKLNLIRDDGSTQELSKSVKVWSTKFPFSRFWLRPAKKRLMVPELINQEWAQIEKALMVEEPVQRWKGRFALPVDGTISQGFGYHQIINGRRGGSHRGVDFEVPNGTEVRAPNQGKVVFVKRLKVFGGTMVLDHGQGIHTLYFHLSKIIARVGEDVDKGDIIALSGDSGISSAPHLHWGLSVHNLRVDPLQWVKYEI